MDYRRPTGARKSTESGFTLAEILIAATLTLMLGLGVISAYLFLGRNFTRLGNTQVQDVKARRALFYFTRDVSSAISLTSTTANNLTMTVPNTLTLSNGVTTAGSKNVTCTSTAGLVVGMTLSCLPSIATSTTVSSITNATTFVMSANAAASGTSLTINAVGTSATVSYLYNTVADPSTDPDTPANSLTRKPGGSSSVIILLTDISATASNPSNGFVYYNTAGAAVTSGTSVRSIEFAFTTKVGTASIGTLSAYKIVSPRVIVRNMQFLP